MRIFFTLFLLPIISMVFPQPDSTSSNPDSWKISYSTVFTKDGKPINEHVSKLIDKLEAEEGEGLPVKKDEFINYLKREEAELVYAKELVKYATPKSRYNQKVEHNNYAKVFLKKKRIDAGVKFLKEYREILIAAEKKYNVSRKDIVAILMWESGLGEFTGNHRVFNIFMGQLLFLDQAQEYAIDQMRKNGEEYPSDKTDTPEKQQERFEALRKSAVKGLAAIFRYSKLQGFDPMLLKGSWGGAIGYTQFMPYRLNLAVDGDSNGVVDLFSWPDAIFSVANYLKEFGNYKWDYKNRKRAIRSYNPNDEYMHGVIAYADAVWKKYTGH